MEKSSYWSRRRQGSVSRRHFLGGSALIGGGLTSAFLVGCGGDDDSTSKTASPAGSATKGAAASPSAAATSAAKRGGTLTMARTTNVTFADPQRTSGGSEAVFNRLYAETLLRYEGDKIVANLAESFEQPDPATVTLKLRKDIKFSDGTPLNAEAVKYSVTRGQDAKLNAPVRPALSLIQAVETPDEYTAVLKLTSPNAIFLPTFLPSSFVISPTALEKMGPDEFNKKPVSAGQYTIDRIVQDGDSIFLKNPDWPIKAPNGDQLPYLDKIVNRIIPENETIVAALLSGDVQLVNNVPLESVKQVKSSNIATGYEVPAGYADCVEFIINKPPTDILNLRKAINYAINRNELNQQIAFGLAGVATDCLTPDSWVFDPSLPRYEYDPKKAAEALAAAGYPDGIDLKLATYAQATAEAIQQQLAKVKIRVTVDKLEVAVYQDKFRVKGEYPIATATATAENGELYNYFLTRLGSKGAYNPGRPQNPDWDALITKVQTTMDQKDRKKLYQDMLKKAYDESYRAWTITTPVYYGLSKKLQGVTILQEKRYNPDLRRAWLA